MYISKRPVRAALKSPSYSLGFLGAVFALSFTFDFKGAEGGSTLQYAMTVIDLTAFALLGYLNRFHLPRSGNLAHAFWVWLLFLSVGTVGAMSANVPMGHYLKTIFSFILFAQGLLVAWWVARDERASQMLLRAMYLAALLSTLFILWQGFSFTGKDVQTIRYKIASPLLPFLLTTSGYYLFIARRHQLGNLIIILIGLGIMTLTVTRGNVLVVGVVVVVVLIAFLINLWRRARIPRFIVRTLWGGAAVILIVVATTIAFAPNISERWVNRSFGEHNDVTYYTRLAAVAGQWQQMKDSPVAMLVGSGFGHEYYYAHRVIAPFARYISYDAMTSAKWFPGEFMWMSLLYYGGLLAGALVAVILLFACWKVLLLLARMMRQGKYGGSVATRLVWIAALGFLVFFGDSFTANPFINRLAPLYMGLCLGIVLTLGNRVAPTLNSNKDKRL